MQERNRYIVTLAITIIFGAGWLWLLRDIANQAIADPIIVNLVAVLLLAVGGGLFVSMIPLVVYGMLPSEEDEITGEEE